MVNPLSEDAQLLILGMLLDSQGKYGLEMVEESNGKLERGTIYVTLQLLVDEGLVTSHAADPPQHGGLTRQIYVITLSGRCRAKAYHNSKAATSDQSEDTSSSFDDGIGWAR